MKEWNIPILEIGNLKIRLIQGGMGVGISGANLASAVANEGGAGVIASVGLGFMGNHVAEEMKKIDKSSLDKQKQYDQVYTLANKNALKVEIREARKKTNGVIGVNIMHAVTDYAELVKTAIEENVDLIISGAGIPRDLPTYLNGKDIKLLPIVSSAKLAQMMCTAWGRYNHLPDAIVVEGPKAGGHLGFERANPNKPNLIDNLDNSDFVEKGLEKIIQEVVTAVKSFETSERKIPVIAAGGIYYGGDIKKFLNLGASGVQMATRFVTTNECDANIKFKETYLNAKKEDLVLINSPVGMPGRAINNQFLEEVAAGERKPTKCPYHCLKTCIPENSPYCIAKALIDAKQGKGGYAFAGSNAWRTNEIVSVHKVFEDLNQEFLDNIISD